MKKFALADWYWNPDGSGVMHLKLKPRKYWVKK